MVWSYNNVLCTYLLDVVQMNILKLAKQVGYPIQHEEWRKATEEFANLVEAAARADERDRACAYMRQMHDAYSIASYPPRGTT
jgi:hypothetical protein